MLMFQDQRLSLCWILSGRYFLWLQQENAFKEILEDILEISESPWTTGGKQGFHWNCRYNIVNYILEKVLVCLISCRILIFLRPLLAHSEETGGGGCAKSFLIPSWHDGPGVSFSSRGICMVLYAPFQELFNWMHREKWSKASFSYSMMRIEANVWKIKLSTSSLVFQVAWRT